MKPTLKRTLLGAVVAVCAIGAAACGNGGGGGGGGSGSDSGGETYEWKLAETHPKDYPTTKADIWFADELRKRSDGRIDVQVSHSAQLGEERDVLQQVQMGAIEMTRVSASPVSEFADSWRLFSLPYLFDDEDHLWRFLDSEYGQQLLDDLSSAQYKGLAYYDAGARNFYTVDRPIESPADVKGLSIRVIAGAVNADMIEALNGSPEPMDYGEVYSALETGVVDGAENNEPSYVSSGHWEIAKHYTRDAHQRIPEVLVLSSSLWEELSEEDKQLVQEVAADSVPVQRDLWDKEVQKSIKMMQDEGIEVHDVDVAEFQQAVEPMMEQYGDEFTEGLNAIDAARE